MRPRALALVLAVALAASCDEPRDPARGVEVRAARALWAMQQADGSWRSEKYAVLRSGQALTPFVLLALLDADESARPADGVERALAWIRAHVDERGCLGANDAELLEYPTYATAYAVRCLVRAGRPGDRPLVARMTAWLAAQQLAAANGFERGAPGHGGFAFGARPPRAGDPGHVDLAHTRRALAALREAGALSPATAANAEAFLAALQRPDGGFFFSTVVLAANKGRKDAAGAFRSYATATADGALALLAAGVPRDDARVTAARRWLEEHPALDAPEGIPKDHPEPWHRALHVYHLAVRAEAQDALGVAGDWRRPLREHLAACQRPDGSFANDESSLMKEDDPVLATALATLALAHAR